MLDRKREDLVERGSIWDWVPTLLAFLAIYTTLFIFYRPDLLFSITTTAGGDTGAHHYPAQYLIQELLPNFRLTGWAPGWYAGMPMLTFYFPFPFLLIAIMDWFMAYEVAFKIGTVLGVFALPAAAYAMGRLWRVRRPFPIFAAVFALVFLLMESYSIYGGNILSTLAGEFGYMLSFALVFLLPFLPDDLACFAAGLTTIPIPALMIVAITARAPGILVSSWVGANAEGLSAAQWVMLIAGSAVLAGLALLYVLIEPAFIATSSLLVGVLFIVQQVFMFVRAWSRVMVYAGEVGFFADRRTRQNPEAGESAATLAGA